MSAKEYFFAIDCGNSRLKATRLSADPEEAPEVMLYGPEECEALIDMIGEEGRKYLIKGALSVVGKVDARMAESLRQGCGGAFMVLTPATPLPVEIRYRTPLTLGLDRRATSCGAAVRFPGEELLVVDAGTALTLDRISAGGKFEGGNIAPGIRMRLKSLHDFTARLPFVEDPEGPTPDFGYDTPTAIRSGVVEGIADEVAGSAMRAFPEGEGRVVLTGGDAPLIAPRLGRRLASFGRSDITVDYCPHLLAEGLRSIYNYNENET